MTVEFTRQCKAKFFLVFGLATRRNKTTGSFTYKWVRMTSLGDHALFLGPACCKAVHVSAVDKHGLVEANHIYYYSSGGYENPLAREDLGSCVVDCWKSDGVQHSEDTIAT